MSPRPDNRRPRETNDEALERETKARRQPTPSRPKSRVARAPNLKAKTENAKPESAEVSARVSPKDTQQRTAFYLRSGTIQALKPLRYERRVARNRAIVWAIISGSIILLVVLFLINLLRH